MDLWFGRGIGRLSRGSLIDDCVVDIALASRVDGVEIEVGSCRRWGVASGTQETALWPQLPSHATLPPLGSPLLAIAAGTGEVLMSRLREGRANTARGAAHFLRETMGRVRYGGARGQLTVRADSGFYAHTVVAACREMDVRFSITIRQRASLRDLIEAIPEEDWTPIPYWMDGAADVAETTYTPFQTKPDAAPVRLIVRRVKPTPGSQLAPECRFKTTSGREYREHSAQTPRPLFCLARSPVAQRPHGLASSSRASGIA